MRLRRLCEPFLYIVWEYQFGYQRYEVLAILSAVLLGDGCLYMTTHGLLTLPFMNAVIYVTDNKIEIRRNNKVDVRSWEFISRVDHVASAQVQT